MKDCLDIENTVVVEINGELDLHTFSPKDIKYLIPDYLEECQKKKIFEIRIIHGKGTGVLRKSVHAIINRLKMVKSYRLADETRGSWGATIVTLHQESREEGDLFLG